MRILGLGRRLRLSAFAAVVEHLGPVCGELRTGAAAAGGALQCRWLWWVRMQRRMSWKQRRCTGLQ